MNRIENLRVGMAVHFKGGNGYVNEGEATSENNDDKVTGFIFNGDTSKIYVSIEDIGIEIDWEKTRESNKDKDMKFTSCQNVDCNKEYDFNDLIDVAVQALKDGVILGVSIRHNEISFMHNNIHHKLMNLSNCSGNIDIIKSLYTETFVINDLSCFSKITENIKSLVLANGCDIIDRIYFEGSGMYLKDGWGNSAILSIDILKGATVTQKRSL